MNIKSFEHIYLIGIGGIGMSALARFFMSQNKKVYGYDKVKTSITSELENKGVNISYKTVLKLYLQILIPVKKIN